MFSSTPNYNKLKTNLRLALNRLKLLEKKKSELALKARKEIADYISVNKVERAKIRVEHIIREDYLVEAMEIVECFCDLLLARMGLIQQMKTLDEGLAEPVSSMIWVAPRLEADVAELREISLQLGHKYGKEYVLSCRENRLETVSPTLIGKLSVQAPPKILIEKYLVEIAKNYGVPYEADSIVMSGDLGPDNFLINLNDLNSGNNKPGNPGSGGSGGSTNPCASANHFSMDMSGASSPAGGLPIGFVSPGTIDLHVVSQDNIPVLPATTLPSSSMPDLTDPPYSPANAAPLPSNPKSLKSIDQLNLPDVPSAPSISSRDEVNFDDLTKRFEALKKRN